MITSEGIASLLDRSVPLVFKRIGPSKWAARTPAGELAYGEDQGLYEWCHGERTDYTSPGSQASDGGGFWSRSPYPEPQQRGCRAALSRVRLN